MQNQSRTYNPIMTPRRYERSGHPSGSPEIVRMAEQREHAADVYTANPNPLVTDTAEVSRAVAAARDRAPQPEMIAPELVYARHSGIVQWIEHWRRNASEVRVN